MPAGTVLLVLSQIQQAVAGLQTSVNALDAKVTALDTQNDALRTFVSDIQIAILHVQDTLGTLPNG